MNRSMTYCAPLITFWTVVALASVGGCDWDKLDPRLGTTTTSSVGGIGGSVGGAGGNAIGGGGGSGGIPVMACNGIAALGADDFEDGTLSRAWVESGGGGGGGGGDVAERNGALELSIMLGKRTRFATTNFRYDFRQASVAVQAIQMPTGSDPYAALIVGDIGTNQVSFRKRDTALEVRKLVANTETVLLTVGYNPVKHAYWRLRHAGDSIFWEVSPDGTSYSILAEHAQSALGSFEYASVQLLLEVPGQNSEVTAKFDNFLAKDGTSDVHCQLDTLSEDFGAPTISNLWGATISRGAASAVQYDGALAMMAAADSTDSSYLYQSAAGYEADGQAVSIEVAQAPTAATAAVLQLSRVGLTLQLMSSQNKLVARYIIDGTETSLANTPAYDAKKHRFWQIRDESGTIFWETSSDGTSWEPLASFGPLGEKLGPMRVAFGVQSVTATPTPGQAIFDNLNLP